MSENLRCPACGMFDGDHAYGCAHVSTEPTTPASHDAGESKGWVYQKFDGGTVKDFVLASDYATLTAELAGLREEYDGYREESMADSERHMAQLAESREQYQKLQGKKEYCCCGECPERAPAVPVGDGWMPIETAPKDGTFFIATGFNYGKSSEPRHYCMALWEQGEWREASEWNGHSSLAYLTHWQPLPAYPPAPSVDGEG